MNFAWRYWRITDDDLT